ncbi:hypothetical protein TNCV_4881171 [Trichonephila clavipes]|nr:hypothetical protein TNCV_4881171 [Trichonephila clavipes]
MVFLLKFPSIIGPGHQNSRVEAGTFPPYPRHARLERDLTIWLDKEVLDKLNGSKTDLRMSSTYRCAVSVHLMMTKGIQLSKEMEPSDHNSWLRACVAGNRESSIGTLPWPSALNDRQDTVGSRICH